MTTDSIGIFIVALVAVTIFDSETFYLALLIRPCVYLFNVLFVAPDSTRIVFVALVALRIFGSGPFQLALCNIVDCNCLIYPS